MSYAVDIRDLPYRARLNVKSPDRRNLRRLKWLSLQTNQDRIIDYWLALH